VVVASNGRRFAAWIIDGLIIVSVAFLLSIPLNVWTGQAVAVATTYVLLRDIGGASPGKRIMGLRVVAKGGGLPSLSSRLLRNATLALTPALSLALNHGLAGLVPGLITTAESLFLLSKGESHGDRLAATTVIRRT
jgi:uncharacterized RDD family membrane protein YckC